MNYSNDSKCDTRTTMDPQDNPTMYNGQRNNISKDRGAWYALPYDIVIIVRNLLTTLITNVVIHY